MVVMNRKPSRRGKLTAASRTVSTALVVSIVAGHGSLAAAELYVATDGKDAWSGRLATPNARQTDGPLATLARARDAVRAIREVTWLGFMSLGQETSAFYLDNLQLTYHRE